MLEILLLRYLNKNSKALENDDNIIKEFDSKTTADVVPKENTTDESATTSYNSSKVKIKEIVVFENQRKWKYKGWISKMLPYERPQFTTNCNNKYNDPGAYITESPEQLDLQVPQIGPGLKRSGLYRLGFILTQIGMLLVRWIH